MYLVGGDDDVDGLNGAAEGLVALLEVHLQLETRKTRHTACWTAKALAVSKMSLAAQLARGNEGKEQARECVCLCVPRGRYDRAC